MIQIFPIHSTSDIITNSSTELFICNTDKTREQIEEMFEVISAVTGPTGVGEIRMLEGPKALLEVLHELESYINTWAIRSVLSQFIRGKFTHEFPKYEAIDFPSFSRTEPWETRWAKHMESRKKAWEPVDAWFAEHEAELAEHIKGFAVVEGDGDNSIPYDLFDLIESRLHAARFHLG